MTITTEVRKAGPFIGNDSASVFPFAFKVFKAADLIVVRRQDNIGTETTLVLDSDYHVTLNGNQDTTPGGVVTLVAGALASGFTLVVSSELPYLQPTDLTNQGGFYPKVITNALDRLTIFCQQLAEITGRTLKLPITAPTNISAEIPLPNPSGLIAWNETGTGLTTVSPQSLVTSIAYGSAAADLFAGDGVTTTFPLTTNPASVNNLDVSVGGFSQRPVQGGIGDYSWNGGASITFVAPPPAPTVPGDKNVLVRYMQAVPVSDSEALHAQTREALRRGYAEAGYTLVAGSFETGGTLTAATDVLLQESTRATYAWTGALPKVVAPGFDPVGVAGFESRTNVILREEMSGDGGAGLSGFSHGETYSSGTVGQKLKQVVAITDAPFLAISGADNTTALDSASLVAEFIFLPPGVWSTTNASFAYWKCYGQGTLLVAGEFAEVNPVPQNGRTLKVYKKRTFGWRENACALSTVANAKFEQTKENTQINGASTSYMASTYMSQDHVGVYGASYNFAAVVTTAASTTYTATSITAPEITEANCVVGMYLRTKHATKYLGKVTAVNYATNTATVDGWWTWGAGVAGTPANGTGTEINPNDKIWALNHNLVLESSGDANRGSGFELGLIINKSGAGVNTWGYDCITLASSETPYAHFISRGKKTHGFLALTNGVYGFRSDQNEVGFEATTPLVAAFRANIGGQVRWMINSGGRLERNFRKLKATNAATYSIALGDCDVLNVYGNAVLTLPNPASCNGQCFRIRAQALCSVATESGLINGAAGPLAMAAGTAWEFQNDGTHWYAF